MTVVYVVSMGVEKDEREGVDIGEGVPETILRPRGNSTSKVAGVRARISIAFL